MSLLNRIKFDTHSASTSPWYMYGRNFSRLLSIALKSHIYHSTCSLVFCNNTAVSWLQVWEKMEKENLTPLESWIPKQIIRWWNVAHCSESTTLMYYNSTDICIYQRESHFFLYMGTVNFCMKICVTVLHDLGASQFFLEKP